MNRQIDHDLINNNEDKGKRNQFWQNIKYLDRWSTIIRLLYQLNINRQTKTNMIFVHGGFIEGIKSIEFVFEKGANAQNIKGHFLFVLAMDLWCCSSSITLRIRDYIFAKIGKYNTKLTIRTDHLINLAKNLLLSILILSIWNLDSSKNPFSIHILIIP